MQDAENELKNIEVCVEILEIVLLVVVLRGALFFVLLVQLDEVLVLNVKVDEVIV